MQDCDLYLGEEEDSSHRAQTDGLKSEPAQPMDAAVAGIKQTSKQGHVQQDTTLASFQIDIYIV